MRLPVAGLKSFRRFSTPASRLLLAAALVATVGFTPAVSGQIALSPAAQRDVQAVVAFKASLSPAEKKMSTNLILASRVAAGKPLGSLARFYVPPAKDAAGHILVDVVGFASPGLINSPNIASIDLVAGHAPGTTFQTAHLRAHVVTNGLGALASQSDVTALREVTGHIHNVGSVTSQGAVAMQANKVNATGVTGTGVRVGVLSDSASAARVAALIASGDLPANTVVLPGQSEPNGGGGSDEGTAMMEIVHDLAPGAQIFFATADNGEDAFAANIEALRFTYHCDIIVDDISYFAESVFQDGTIAAAVNTVTADGALYFSAAANSGNLDSGTSGTWEGDFTPSEYSVFGEVLNNFGTVTNQNPGDQLTSAPNSGVWLHWADPNAASSNDYDLFIFDSTFSNLKAFSANTQDGTQDPIEYVYPNCNAGGYCAAAGDQIAVGLYSGSLRALHIDTERATVAIGTSGATFGHNAAADTFTMAAVYWNAAHQGAKAFTGGPTNPVESFSSDGPRKIFYNPDGTPITAGNYLFATSGGRTLQKPDAAGADGVSVATPGFLPFFGTSAAAPHAAAVAALIKQAAPSLTNTQIRGILTSTALDDMAPGVDRDTGYGIINASAAVAAAKALVARH